MKKLSVLIVLVLLLRGCQPQKEKVAEVKKANYNAYAEIPKEKIDAIESYAELLIDVDNAQVLYEDSPIIAIVEIDSIDRGSNFHVETKEYTYLLLLEK